MSQIDSDVRRQASLIERFRRQAEFAQGYSPLYSQLFAIVAGWLAQGAAGQPIAAWLEQAGAGRTIFDVPLLLLAGLHRDVLAGDVAVRDLAAFYPTVGGDRSPHTPDLAPALHRAIWARRAALATFIQSAQVQTNETGRGLAWLLPVTGSGWGGLHLVDIGASAGLNLVADMRAYRLVDSEGRRLAHIGRGLSAQFQVVCAGELTGLPVGACPPIHSRLGCDIAPFALDSAENERTLAAFIWGDQPQRLQRLREGIAALRQMAQTAAPVQLYPARLPDELDAFLETYVAPRLMSDSFPVILYNTWMRTYLPDKGAGLRPALTRWAQRQDRPVIWLQWEPPEAGEPPAPVDWCALSAEIWRRGQHARWRLGVAHPHGTHLNLAPDWLAWRRFALGLTATG